MMILTFDPWPLACILQSKSSSSQEGPFKGKARTRWKWEIYLLYIEQLLKEFVSVVVNNEHNVEICWKMIHLHRIRDIKKGNMLLESFWDFLLHNCWVNLSNRTNTVVRYNEPCKDECLGRGYSYFWCNTLDNSWDYCSPKGDLNNFGKQWNFP